VIDPLALLKLRVPDVKVPVLVIAPEPAVAIDTVPPVTFPPTFIEPVAASELISTLPVAFSAVDVVKLPLPVTCTLVNVAAPKATFIGVVAIPEMKADPLVFNVRLGVCTDIIDVPLVPMLPDTEVNDTNVLPIRLPLDDVIVPLPLAATLKVGAVRTAPPIEIPALLATCVDSIIKLEALIGCVAVVRRKLFDTDRLVKVAPPAVKVIAEPLFEAVAIPVVFKVNAGVCVLILIPPEPELAEIEVVP
jgi:hypothetical protein